MNDEREGVSMESKVSWKDIVLLHGVFLIVSLGSVASKMAASYPLLSWPFIAFYGLYILALGFYALSWVQIIKRVPLVTAFSNKAVTIVWNMVFGALIFHETITIKSIVAAIIVIAGVILVVTADD